jgi:transposase
MKNQNVIMGVDISKECLDISLNNMHYQYDNNDCGIKKLLNLAKKNNIGKIICEATGGYETALICSCNLADIVICRVNPRQVRDFAKASGKLAKTDKIDAKILVEFAGIFNTRPTNILDNINILECVRQRSILVSTKSDIKKRCAKVGDQFIKTSLQKIIATIEAEIIAFDVKIRTMIEASQSLKNNYNILQSFCGVGATTSAIILAEIPEIGTLSSQEICALTGLAPYNKDSGKKSSKRSIRGGRKPVRNALYMAATVAVRHNAKIKSFYNNLLGRNKPFKLAITAVMRKIIIILNAMVKNNMIYSQNHIVMQ